MENYRQIGLGVGHGAYLISNYGLTFSHISKDQNDKKISFQFTTNDTIYMEFDPFEKKIRFRKNEANSPFL